MLCGNACFDYNVDFFALVFRSSTQPTGLYSVKDLQNTGLYGYAPSQLGESYNFIDLLRLYHQEILWPLHIRKAYPSGMKPPVITRSFYILLEWLPLIFICHELHLREFAPHLLPEHRL